MRKMYKTQKGITLVALVITIIVLVILAAVSINAVMNEGLIKNAKEAKNKSDIASYIEAYRIAELLENDITNQEDILKKAYPNIDYDTNFAKVNDEIVYVGDDEVLKAALSDVGILSMMTGLWNDNTNAVYTGNELVDKLSEGSRVVKLDSNNEYVDIGAEPVGTGNIVLNPVGNPIAYTIVFGDVDGYGNIATSSDLGCIRAFLLGTYSMPFYWAADLNDDGVINNDDQVFMKNVLMGTYNISDINQNRLVRANTTVVLSQ